MKAIAACLLACSSWMCACVPHTINVEPIHMTVEVTIQNDSHGAESDDDDPAEKSGEQR